jgi:hypothetical protein
MQLFILIPAGFVDGISHSLCKLLVTIGDHSTSYLATNLATPSLVAKTSKTKAELVQTFLKLLLVYTVLLGYYGAEADPGLPDMPNNFLFSALHLFSITYTNNIANNIFLCSLVVNVAISDVWLMSSVRCGFRVQVPVLTFCFYCSLHGQTLPLTGCKNSTCPWKLLIMAPLVTHHLIC